MDNRDRNLGQVGTESSLVTADELAERWHKSPRTLQRWRLRGYGPPSMRIGASIFYRWADVLAFEEAAQMRAGDRS